MDKFMISWSVLFLSLIASSVVSQSPDGDANNWGSCVCNPTVQCQQDSDSIADELRDVKNLLRDVLSEVQSIKGGGCPNPPVTRAGDCPDDYEVLEDGDTTLCFKLMDDSLTWEGADTACKALSGRQRLLVLDTEAKYRLLLTERERNKGSLGPWVGLKMVGGQWEWQNTGRSTRLNYDTWWEDEPDDEGCGNVYCGTTNCGLWDASCDGGTRRYYCEPY